MDEKKLSDSNSDVKLVMELLEKGDYLRNPTLTTREVINKVFEFSNFLNSEGRLALLNAEHEECQELVALFLTLKKNIKFAVSEMGQSRTKKIHNYICPECDELIQVPPNNDIWKYLQRHEHFEELYCGFLNGTMQRSNVRDNSLVAIEAMSIPGTSRVGLNTLIAHNDMLDAEHTDSGIDHEEGLYGSCSPEEEEPLGSNAFRFNFKPRYDPVVEAVIYPDSLKSLSKFDNCKYLAIQKISPFRAICLLCRCDLLSTKRISKKQCLDHVLGQRHVKASEDPMLTASLESYHELFWNLEPCIQAHQVYFDPKSPSSVMCHLCSTTVAHKHLVDHIQGVRHKHFIMMMYSKQGSDFYLLDVQVRAYGVDTESPEAEKPKTETPDRKVRERREKRRSTSNTSRDEPEVEHNIIRSRPHPGNNMLQDLCPHRFKEHIKCFRDRMSSVGCDVCRINFRREPDELKNHILRGQHQQLSKIGMPEYTYFCEICNIKFSDEFTWDKHFNGGPNRHSKIPKSRINNVTEYECTTCKTVIFGDEVSLTRHKNRRGGRKPDKPKEPTLPAEVTKLFVTCEAIEKEGEWLVREANNTVTCLDKTSECCTALEAVLATSLDQCTAYPFGSRVSGLGNKSSDLDLFIDTGDMYFGRRNQDSLSQCQIVMQVASILIKHKEEFNKIQQVRGARTPIVKVHHVATGLDCDLSFRHGLSVENTKFLSVCLKMQPIAQSLILILKKWSEFNKFPEHISTYALAVLAIFFLQVNGYLLSVKKLKELNPLEAPVISGWETIKYTTPVESMKNHVIQYEHSVVRLLKDFFMYYATFNYFEDAVCPLLGHTIKRKLFQDPRELPPEMITYVKQLRGEEPEEFRYLSPFCIQDPFDLSHNLTKACQGNTLATFKKLCELSYCHLDSLK